MHPFLKEISKNLKSKLDVQYGDIDEDENTISILNRYIDESEFNYNKTIIKGILQDIYKQASEVE